MSYAGTYGPDETCEHDSYWRSCWKCNGDVERFVEDYPRHMAHAEAVKPALGGESFVAEHVVTMYEASCPGCEARRTFRTKAEAISWYSAHANRVRDTARNWRNSPEMMAEVRRRGLTLP